MSDDGAKKPWLEGVEGMEAKLLIECDKAYIQVVAGPGSGKTLGLERRVRRLVDGDGVPRRAIFVGTFTRAIRDELAASLLPTDPDADRSDRLTIETLHSQAYAMLRHHPASHPGRVFRFLLAHEEAAMLYDLKDAAPDLDYYDRRDEMHKVESFWSHGGTLDDDRFRGAMASWLQEHRATHINEVVFLALNAIERGDLPAGVFTHVVVDEYQDLTLAEQELVARLCPADGCLTVLGDDDQSIYRFRYNHPGGITEFPNGKDARKLEQITISENRRCGETIVDLANRMMAEAGSRKPAMVSRRGEAGEVNAVYWATLEDEISGLAAYVTAHADTRFLVLVARREIGYRLRSAVGTDAWTSFHEEVLRTDLVRERFALASLAANEGDPVALRAWFGLKGDGPEAAQEQNSAAVKSLRASGLLGRDLIEGIVSETVKPTGKGQLAVRRRAQRYIDCCSELAHMDLRTAIGYLFDPDLASAITDSEKQRYAREDLELLRDAAIQIEARMEDATLIRVIDVLRYRISTRQPLLEVEPNARVRIMTLHGAKGLEADVIIVAGLADQILPGKNHKDPNEAEARRAEQRRLLYVAVTRAKRRLILSWPQTMTFADARSQSVRLDKGSSFRSGRTLMVRLTSCRFVPAGLTARDGRAWSRRN